MTWKRTISAHYSDPVDRIWLTAAEELGLRVERAEDVYASYDGRGTLRITRATDFDADDSLAQLVFHELCHAAVAGEHAFEMVDWGLCNDDDRDVVREHACHRLQAQWARRHGLRQLLSVTTDHRPYWDALPEDPLSGDEDPATSMARAAWIYARSSVLWSPIERARADVVDDREAAALDGIAQARERRTALRGLRVELPLARRYSLSADGASGARRPPSCARRAGLRALGALLRRGRVRAVRRLLSRRLPRHLAPPR